MFIDDDTADAVPHDDGTGEAVGGATPVGDDHAPDSEEKHEDEMAA